MDIAVKFSENTLWRMFSKQLFHQRNAKPIIGTIFLRGIWHKDELFSSAIETSHRMGPSLMHRPIKIRERF
jgi:hypothetical protein